MREFRIVEQPPTAKGGINEGPVADWDEIARAAVDHSPNWIELPNMYRPHAQQIKKGEKKAFRKYRGQWEVKTRKRDEDDDKRATLYIRYLP